MALVGSAVLGTTSAGATGSRYYLALGDSVPVWDGLSSYPYLIASHYGIPKASVVDIACSGATTTSMISGPSCASLPGGKRLATQLREAAFFLHEHRGSVTLVTIDIGGNDFLKCAVRTGINLTCVKAAERTTGANLTSILKQLRNSAGASVPVIGMNYYDPFLGDWLAGGATRTYALASVPVVDQVDAFLSTTYADASVPVANVKAAFHTNDLSHRVASRWGHVPVAVDDACTWLDIVCTAGQPEGFGDDPVASGAVVITHAFERVIGKTP